jgi:hypothetical protein
VPENRTLAKRAAQALIEGTKRAVRTVAALLVGVTVAWLMWAVAVGAMPAGPTLTASTDAKQASPVCTVDERGSALVACPIEVVR